MNFLFVNQYANAPAYGNPYRTYYIAKELVRLGHSVSIVAAGYSHLRLTQPVMTSGITEETHDGITYIFLPTLSGAPGSRIERVRNIIGFQWSYARYLRQIAEKACPDVVVEATTHILPFFVSARIAKATGAKLIYEVRDLWPASPIEISGKSKNHPLFFLIGQAQKYALKRADCVVSTLRYANEYFTEHVSAPKMFAHIQNGVDLDAFDELSVQRGDTLASIEAIKTRFVGCIGYAGGLGAANGVQSLLGAAEALAQKDIAIVLVGNGARRAEFDAYVEANKLTNVFIFSAVSKPEIIPIIQIFDLGYSGGVNRGVHRYGISPNKIFDYMLSGVPVLACYNTKDDFLDEAGCGIMISNPSGETVAAAADKFFGLPAEAREKMGQNGRNAALEKYDYRVLTQSYLDVVSQLKA